MIGTADMSVIGQMRSGNSIPVIENGDFSF